MVERLPVDLRKYLFSLFEEHVDRTLELLRSQMLEPVATVDLQLVTSLCNLLEAFLSEKFGFKSGERPEYKKRYLSYAFTFAFIWSLGASVHESHHVALDRYIRDKFQSIIFPNVDTVYAYFLETAQTDLSFKHWNDRTPEFA